MLISPEIFENRPQITEEDYETKLKFFSERIEDVFKTYSFDATIVNSYCVHSSYVFEVKLEMGSKFLKLRNAIVDLELATGMYVTINRRPQSAYTVAIILNSDKRSIVGIREILESKEFIENPAKLLIPAGRASTGEPLCIDLDEAINILVYGTTGSGKSVFLDDIIIGLTSRCTPEELQLVLIDIKGVDLRYYNGIPHTRFPAIDERIEAANVLAKVMNEIEIRRELFTQNGVKSFEQYNNLKGVKKLPNIVVIIDEFMSLTTDPDKNGSDDIAVGYKDEIIDIIELVNHIASRCRSVGIRMVVATQFLLASVFPTRIQSNFLHKVRFAAFDKETVEDSKTQVITKLLGNGDMKYMRSADGNLTSQRKVRAQASYVTPEEVKRYVEELKKIYKK